MRNDVIQNLRSYCAARIPESAGMGKQEIARGSPIKMQVGSHSKRVSRVKEEHRSILLSHAIFEEVVHPDTNNHRVRARTLAKQPLQPVQPIVVARLFQENRRD